MGTKGRERTMWAVAAIMSVASSVAPGAQAPGAAGQPGQPGQPSGLPTEITQVRFNSGQSVVPYYEGWIKNPDGSFDLVFGYFNRNWKQEIYVPVGADNKVEPMAGDQGQPTYFLPRRQRWAYRVKVPANFGKQTVIWTITANGKTERGYGDLLPAQEITERVVMTNGSFDPGEDDPNKPPTLDIGSTFTVKVSTPLSLAAAVADDGLPKPRNPPAPRPVTANDGRPAQFTAQVNSSNTGRPRGLRVSWMQYRGPEKVLFEPAEAIPIQGAQGTATTTARFTAPGTYKLIAMAADGAMTIRREVTVTVTPP
jgi:hypothetical protein